VLDVLERTVLLEDVIVTKAMAPVNEK